MVKHIVMWKFREGEEEKRDLFLSRLSALQGVIPQLKSSTVAKNEPAGGWDAVLISEFESYKALDEYKNDPRHREVSALCKSIRTDRASVDFEF